MISQHYVKKFRKYFRHNEIIYKTTGSNYKTKYNLKIDFTLPGVSKTKTVNNLFRIDSSKDNTLGYDMIIGQDIMKKLGMIVDFNNENLI